MRHEQNNRRRASLPCVALLALLGLDAAPIVADEIIDAERQIFGFLIDSYGSTDWNGVEARMQQVPDDDTNPNVMVIPLSLANAFLERYISLGDAADLDRSIAYCEWVARDYPLWSQRWLTPAVAQYLALTILRVRSHETADTAERLTDLWSSATAVLEREADARLHADLPYRERTAPKGKDPYDSSVTGDSRSEENAWEAAVLAGAANFMPQHPHSVQWDSRARQLAYDAITRPSDSPDAFGVKTTTVPETFELANHGKFPNPYYMAATLFLLCQGGLSYHLVGRPIPEEFAHNVMGLFTAYRRHVAEDLRWTVVCDPGDATMFPIPYDPEFERVVVLQCAARGYLAAPVGRVTWLSFGDDLWTAVQNAKTLMYHLMGSYLWRSEPLMLAGPLPHSAPYARKPQSPVRPVLEPITVPDPHVNER